LVLSDTGIGLSHLFSVRRLVLSDTGIGLSHLFSVRRLVLSDTGKGLFDAKPCGLSEAFGL
jgi:hypothetical protein